MPKPHSDPLNTQVTPEPALEKRTRRQFKPEYKLRMMAEADACKHGELGALLRREKLYSNQLSAWRREYAENGVAGLSKSAPGPAPSKTPAQRRIEPLEKENNRLNRKLESANDCLDLQKNLVDARSFTQWEGCVNNVITHRPARRPLSQACRALGLNRSSVYAHRKRADSDLEPQRSRQYAVQPRALSAEERATVIDTLHSEPYCDQPPAEVYHRLLEQEQYLCSVSTLHRLLRSMQETGDRRNQRPAQHHAIPRLLATGPHDVWTWDITKLPLVRRGIYLSLYVVLDLFSRFVVAWMVSRKENSALAKQLMDEATTGYGIEPGQLTLHQDRGSPMIAHGYLDLMRELDVTCSHSRPRVSNDNAFSESQFKTQKYQPDYPGRFDTMSHARLWCEGYFHWYNFKHHHSGLAGFTPEQVFTGRYRDVVEQKQRALDERYRQNPERFVRGRPRASLPPATVAINPVESSNDGTMRCDRVNFPTLTAAGYVK